MAFRIAHLIGSLVCFGFAIIFFWLGLGIAAGDVTVNELAHWEYSFSEVQFMVFVSGFLAVTLSIVGGICLFISTAETDNA